MDLNSSNEDETEENYRKSLLPGAWQDPSKGSLARIEDFKQEPDNNLEFSEQVLVFGQV